MALAVETPITSGVMQRLSTAQRAGVFLGLGIVLAAIFFLLLRAFVMNAGKQQGPDQDIGKEVRRQDVLELENPQSVVGDIGLTTALRGVLASELDGKLVVNGEGIILFANASAELLLGRRQFQLVGEAFGLPLVRGRFTEVDILHGVNKINVEMFCADIEWEGAAAYLVSLHDITRYKQAETKVKHLHKLYVMLIELSASVATIRNQQKLFDEICRIAARQGCFRVAWVGLLDGRHIKIAAMACGAGEEDRPGMIDPNDPGVESDIFSLLAQAFREGKAISCNDVATDPQLEHGRKSAFLHDCGSIGIFPLHRSGDISGFLVLHAPEKHFFDVDEMNLIMKCVAGVSLALGRAQD